MTKRKETIYILRRLPFSGLLSEFALLHFNQQLWKRITIASIIRVMDSKIFYKTTFRSNEHEGGGRDFASKNNIAVPLTVGSIKVHSTSFPLANSTLQYENNLVKRKTAKKRISTFRRERFKLFTCEPEKWENKFSSERVFSRYGFNFIQILFKCITAKILAARFNLFNFN